MPFLRRSYKQKPQAWGPVSAVQASVSKNAERVGIDPGSIVGYWPLWEKAGTALRSVVGGINATAVSAPYVNDSVETSGSTPSKIEWPLDTRLYSDTFSVLLNFAATKDGLSHHYFGNHLSQYNWVFETKSSNDIDFVVATSGGWRKATVPAGSWGSDKDTILFGTVGDNAIKGYVGGIQVGGTSGLIRHNTSYKIYAGASHYYNTFSAAKFKQFAYFDCVLNAAQIAYLSDNPYFLLHRVAPVFYSVPQSGPVTFKPYWANQATRIAI